MVRRMTHPFSRSVLAGLTASAVLAVLAGAPAGAAPAAPAATPGCTPRTNVEFIIDDSGSMAFNDPGELRLSALGLFLALPASQSRSVGVVDFASRARSVVASTPVSTGGGGIYAAVDNDLVSSGSTNYDDAANVAKAANPAADAFVFLTDGQPTVRASDGLYYHDQHVGGPPVYVVSFGDAAQGENLARLQRIAADTGGTFNGQSDSARLQAIMAGISARLACQTLVKPVISTVSGAAKVLQRSARVPVNTKRVQVVITWSDPNTRFDITKVVLTPKGGTGVAVPKNQVRVTRGRGFVVFSVLRPKAGTLSYRVKVVKGVPVRVQVVTQTTPLR